MDSDSTAVYCSVRGQVLPRPVPRPPSARTHPRTGCASCENRFCSSTKTSRKEPARDLYASTLKEQLMTNRRFRPQQIGSFLRGKFQMRRFGADALASGLLVVVSLPTLGYAQTPVNSPAPPMPGRLVATDAGHKLHLWCTGEGPAPTVILVTGAGGSSVRTSASAPR